VLIVFNIAGAACFADTVTVGLYEKKPKVFTDENGRPAGIFIDILDGIAEEEGWTLMYVPCKWAECLSALEDGSIDLMPDVAYSPERDEKFDFNRIPVAESWSQVYSNPHVAISRMSDLDGRKVALLRDSIQHRLLEQKMNGFGFDMEIVPVESYAEAFSVVEKGTADAAITNHFFGDYCFQDFGLEKAPIVFNVVSLYYATAGGRNAELLEAIDESLGKWVEEPGSIYYTTLARWTEKPPRRVVPPYIYWIIGAVAALLVVSGLMILLMRSQVSARTKHLEEAYEGLRKTEQMLDMALDATGDGIWDWNTKTGDVYWSPSSYTMLGYEAGEMPMDIDRWRELLYPGDRERVNVEVSERTAAGDGSFSTEYRCATKDGGWAWINARGRAVEFGENGEPLRVIGIHTNITRRRQVEDELERHRNRLEELVEERTGELLRTQEQLIQSQKMEVVGQLAGGISHDFNNMLAVILGTAQVVLAKLDPGDPNHGRLSRIIKTGKKAKDITGRLLTFARKEKLDISNVPVQDILREMVEMLRSTITKKIDIETSIPDKDILIRGDANQLGQAFLNICINACDAMEEGGTMGIDVSTVDVDEEFCRDHFGLKPGRYCLVSIRDEGQGIPENVLKRIFEPFFTTKKKGAGTGLGLSVTEGIVKMNNGFMEIESETGKGTVASVYLPVAKDAGEKKPGGNGGELRGGNLETVLVVDDEKDFTDMIIDFLSEEGYNPIPANSGREAVETFKEKPDEIDLVILDIMMPGMDGAEVFEALHEIRDDVKVVLCSGYSVEGKAGEMMQRGASAFVQKPFDNSSLLDTISDTLKT